MPSRTRGPRLIIVRHGPAAERDPRRWPDDTQRPLTPEGATDTRKSAKGLYRYIGEVDHIVTSSAVRCRVTADMVRDAFRDPPRVEVWEELGPGLLAPPIFARLARTMRRGQQLVLVGHDPTLTELIGLSLVGEGTPFAKLGKGGAVCIEFPRSVKPAAGLLLWHATRKQLARAG
jgi:phosphohistidine phosphatase